MNQAGILALGIALLGIAEIAAADERGALVGQFVFDGVPPVPAVLETSPRMDCAKERVLDESLIVSKEGGIANVVVGLYLERDQPAPAADPKRLQGLPESVVIQNKKCRLTPHIQILFAGRQSLVLDNPETYPINVKSTSLQNTPFNRLIGREAKITIEAKDLAAREVVPIPLSNGIHYWMRGLVVVVDHPYVALTDEQGKFKIEGISAGKHIFKAWQEKAGNVREIKQNGAAKEWVKGRFEVEIKAGQTLDIGTILVAPRIFER